MNCFLSFIYILPDIKVPSFSFFNFIINLIWCFFIPKEIITVLLFFKFNFLFIKFLWLYLKFWYLKNVRDNGKVHIYSIFIFVLWYRCVPLSCIHVHLCLASIVFKSKKRYVLCMGAIILWTVVSVSRSYIFICRIFDYIFIQLFKLLSVFVRNWKFRVSDLT